jgi:hypothetical protein
MTLEQFYQTCDLLVAEENGCKLWSHRYPKVKVDGQKEYLVTRLLLERKLGRPLTPWLFACHTCDNPCCVNPDHLYAGTVKDNAHDRTLKMNCKPRKPKPTKFWKQYKEHLRSA